MPASQNTPHTAAVNSNRASRELAAAIERLPVVRRVLARYGGLSLREYVRGVTGTFTRGVQARDDLVEIIERRCERSLGPALARAAGETLSALPAVLTANHHGVDFFAQSVQGTLAFSLAAAERCTSGPGAAIVLACGAIPLNNLTYPRGLLMYLEGGAPSGRTPVRVPLFPDRFKRETVCTCPPLDADMVARARARLGRLCETGKLAPELTPVADALLADDYADPSVLALSSYSEQATVLNHRLWARLFQQPDATPQLAYLELERIASDLLVRDLADPSSLASILLLEPRARAALLSALDGHRSCWDRGALARRLLDGACGDAAPGTVFFWGIDDARRRIPLSIASSDRDRLVGVSDAGQAFEVALEPKALATALKNRKLLPSLFTSYLCVSLARGVSCLGGYYQAEYLPAMQRGVVAALEAVESGSETARRVARVVTDGYLSGMQAVMSPARAGGLSPAGPVEIIAGGGLSDRDLERIGTLRVYDAHLGSTVDTVLDAARELIDGPEWQDTIALDLAESLGGSAVVKTP